MKSVDTSYILLNNHYIVKIDNYYYLLDTGSDKSYTYNPNNKYVEINGHNYPLHEIYVGSEMEEMTNLIGIRVDGLIGMDIISKTSLSIYKNGIICFEAKYMGGTKVRMLNYGWPIMIKGESNGIKGNIVLDTGAKYGYGVSELTVGKTPYAHVRDYNPYLKRLISDNYHIDVKLPDQDSKPIDICYNQRVEEKYLLPCNAIMITNITNLYNRAIVLNMEIGEVVID